MLIKIENISCNLETRHGEKIKIYRVPEEYSEDGLFIAQWSYGEIEPFPGCLGSDAMLIADGAVSQDKDENLEFSGYLAEGVEINAQN